MMKYNELRRLAIRLARYEEVRDGDRHLHCLACESVVNLSYHRRVEHPADCPIAELEAEEARAKEIGRAV